MESRIGLKSGKRCQVGAMPSAETGESDSAGLGGLTGWGPGRSAGGGGAEAVGSGCAGEATFFPNQSLHRLSLKQRLVWPPS